MIKTITQTNMGKEGGDVCIFCVCYLCSALYVYITCKNITNEVNYYVPKCNTTEQTKVFVCGKRSLGNYEALFN